MSPHKDSKRRKTGKSRSAERGLADRGGWREASPPMPELQISSLLVFL